MPTDKKPYDHARTFERVTVHLLPQEAASLRMLAVGRAEPGCKPNISATFRHVLRDYLERKTARRRKSKESQD